MLWFSKVLEDGTLELVVPPCPIFSSIKRELDKEVSVDCTIPPNAKQSFWEVLEKIPLPRICSSTLRSSNRFGFILSLRDCLLFLDLVEDLAFDAEFLEAELNFSTVNLVLNGDVWDIFVVSDNRTLSGGEA
jgi:hypothetical protein